MVRRFRRRFFGPYCGFWGWHHPYYGPYGPPPPPWWAEEPTSEEEKEYLKEHVEALKAELAAAEKRIEELEKSE
jgi:hypothetical protein